MVSHPILEDDPEPEEGEDQPSERRQRRHLILHGRQQSIAIVGPFAFSRLRKSGTPQLKICVETPSERLPRSNKHCNIIVRFFHHPLLTFVK